MTFDYQKFGPPFSGPAFSFFVVLFFRSSVFRQPSLKCDEIAIVYSVRREAMRLSGNWLVVYSLVTTILYQLLRLVFTTVQRIYWQLNGTAQKRREARLPHNYERSAQVLDVVLFHEFCVPSSTTLSNFLCTHNRFENPQYIIDNDNITLLTINEYDAVFCEAKEKGRLLCKLQERVCKFAS